MIEHMFGELMAATDNMLTINDIMELNHFLNHGEYGLALETMVAILAEIAPVPREIVQRIKVMAIHMEMTELSLSDLMEAA
jgi:hypothetical protein